MRGDAVLDAVLHQRLQQDAGDNDVERVRIEMFVDAQLVPAKADYFDIEIVVDKFDLFAKLDELIVFAQQAAQDLRELQDELTRAVGIKTDQRRNRVQRVKQKVRIDLALQRVQARFEQKPLLLFQLRRNARVVGGLDRNGDGSDHSGETREDGPRRVSGNVYSKQTLRPRIGQLDAAGLQRDDDEKESRLPVNARTPKIAPHPAVDAHGHEEGEGPYLFFIAAEVAQPSGQHACNPAFRKREDLAMEQRGPGQPHAPDGPC